MKRITTLLALISALLAAVAPTRAQETDVLVDSTPTSPWSYHWTNEDRLAAAQACVSEASWAGARRAADCGGILQVTMTRRHRGESVREALVRTMPRFFGGRTSRAWVLALTARPIRVDPPGWPYEVPASHYSDSWRAVYARTQRFIDGEEPLPCAPTPNWWFGRVTDHEAITRALDRGRVEVSCGEPADGETHATVNVFMAAAVDVD